MNNARRLQLVHRYEDASRAVVVAMEHVPSEHLDQRPPKGGWSPREVIHHLANAALVEGLRFRRMLAENKPMLEHWDETQYSRHLHYDRPIEASLETFQALTKANVELLRVLSDEEWKREGNQQRMWPLSVESWLEDNLDHIHDRLMQILNAVSGGQVITDPDP